MTFRLPSKSLVLAALLCASCSNPTLWKDEATGGFTKSIQFVELDKFWGRSRCVELRDSVQKEMKGKVAYNNSDSRITTEFLLAYVGRNGFLGAVAAFDSMGVSLYSNPSRDSNFAIGFGKSSMAPCFISFQVWTDAHRSLLIQGASVKSEVTFEKWRNTYAESKESISRKAILRLSSNSDSNFAGALSGPTLDAQLYLKLTAKSP